MHTSRRPAAAPEHASPSALIEEHVDRFVHAFISPDKWIGLLIGRNTAAGRRRFRSQLAIGLPLAPGHTVDAAGLTEAQTYERLRLSGAPATCVLVKDGLLEDEVTTLESALHRAYSSGAGTLISCLPGRLCLLQSADGARLILHRRPPAPGASRYS